LTELVYSQDEVVKQWVAARIPHVEGYSPWDTAIGVSREGQMIAGVVYSRFSKQDINLSIAATDPRWCTRRTLRYLLGYPFLQLKVRRVTALVAVVNSKSRDLVERLGFQREGVLRDWFEFSDVLVYGMLRREASRWVD
jgi:RimJ/RimL family protein N-acetyltransferase